MRLAAIAWCVAIPGLNVYLFRRKRADLIKNHMEGVKGFRALLAPWVEAGYVQIVEDEIRFLWNGSKIFMCHCQHEKDMWNYQGAEIHVLLIDELTHFTENIYRFLRNRVRAVGLELPNGWEGSFPRILCSSNPGQIGHHWVKATFIDKQMPYQCVQQSDEEGGMLRQFIPARLEDNPSMAQDDPGYRARLRGLHSPEMVRAMELGDWNIVVGAYFSNFGEQHIIPPFEIPESWSRFRSFDWGYSHPFSVGWWAVANGEQPKTDHMTAKQKERLPYFPANAIVRYREWYGAVKPNVGLKLQPAKVAQGIKERSGGEKYAYSVADPACFDGSTGPSIAETMAKHGVVFSPGDNKRIPGWLQVQGRLDGLDDSPMMFIVETCRAALRTLPAVPRSETNIEDIDTHSEDHLPDEVRYACMSRPWSRPPEPTEEELAQAKKLTFDQVFKEHQKKKRRRRR